jgi:hypothetical protein
VLDYKPPVSIGYIYKITDSKGKNYIGSPIDYKRDGDNTSKQARICHCIGLLKIMEMKNFSFEVI